MSSTKGYLVSYRNRVFKGLGECVEVYSPTHVAIKLDRAIIVIYSIYDYQTLNNYIQEILT